MGIFIWYCYSTLMDLTQQQIKQLVKNHYGINVSSFGRKHEFDASSMTKISQEGDKTVLDMGKLCAYEVLSGVQKLAFVEYQGVLTRGDDLFTWLQDIIWDGRRLTELKATIPQNGIYLYSAE
jgi:hypothetical protein